MAAPFDQWRKCWEAYLLGAQENPDGEYERQVIVSIDRMAALPLDFKGYGDDSECTVASPVFGLRARALAWRTKGSKTYQDPEALRGILEDLERFYHEDYNEQLGPDKTESWWFFEIGGPLRILDILVLLWEELPDREEKVRRFTDVILHFKDAYKASSRGREETGANLMWKCHILLLTGILREETEWIEWANEKIPTTLAFSHPMEMPMFGRMYDDGFYEDGSFIQHYMFAYTGGYGKHFLSILCGLLFAFRGQDCLRLPEESRRFLFRMVEEAYLPLLYKGHLMDVCRGREPSRYWCEDGAAGSIVLRALVYLRECLPEDEAKLLSAQLKEQLAYPEARTRLFYDFHPSAEYFATPSLAEELRALDACNGDAAPEQEGHHGFYVMCKPVHRTKRYASAVSMYSKQIACYEKLGLESTRFWHMSDGALYLYTGEGSAYAGDYYATADMQRLAGTTVERSAGRDQDPYYNWYTKEARNVYPFAGGTQLGTAGTAAMQARGQGTGTERTLEMKKSWFFFEREIAALGSSITSVTDNPVETIVANDRLLPGKKGFKVFVRTEGAVRELALDGSEQEIRTDALYVSQEAEDGHVSGTGYLFPGGETIRILCEHRKGTWNSTVLNPDHVSENDFLTVWISHGKHPEGAKYQYVILPGASMEEWTAQADAPAVEILENSASAHAVKNTREDLTGITFWEEGTYACHGVEASAEACVLIGGEKSEEKGMLAVSDPTKQDHVLTVRVDDTWKAGGTYTVDTKAKEGSPVVLQV